MRKLEKVGKGSETASKILETISKNYLVLTFSTPAGQYIVPLQGRTYSSGTDREEFCKEFADLEQLRAVHQIKYEKAVMTAKYQADNPSCRGL